LIVPPGMRSKTCALKLKTQPEVDADLSCSNRRMPGGFPPQPLWRQPANGRLHLLGS
jgi:hypothetical protein